MTQEQEKRSGTLADRVSEAEQRLAVLSAEAALSDPALGSRLKTALRALQGSEQRIQNAAILGTASDARALVRDVVAEELSRYWERRFGGTP